MSPPRVVVTGAGADIGAATVRALATAGYEVMCWMTTRTPHVTSTCS